MSKHQFKNIIGQFVNGWGHFYVSCVEVLKTLGNLKYGRWLSEIYLGADFENYGSKTWICINQWFSNPGSRSGFGIRFFWLGSETWFVVSGSLSSIISNCAYSVGILYNQSGFERFLNKFFYYSQQVSIFVTNNFLFSPI